MNQRWLTILMSKGIEIEQNLREQVGNLKDQFKSQLEERGIRLSAADFAAMLEEISPKASHAALGYALDMTRPFTSGMGLRISQLSDEHIEMILPARTRNLNDEKEMHEGAILAASVEAVKILWMRHAPVGDFKIKIQKMSFESVKHVNQDSRIRVELSESVRENSLAALRVHRQTQLSMNVQIQDEQEQTIASVQIEVDLQHTPSLG